MIGGGVTLVVESMQRSSIMRTGSVQIDGATQGQDV